ncbi:SsgA family sporulation/cell division regulator [Streptomyces aidingensis]|uniref:Streptomyces sporulation and cell division protein, SsgA n=1 Tax=Streptomyces aidingensis TaxID=910347 RepID=A0A1I1RFG0_9ACTN|nr:SsgA family sporulation/cell division regulator [Streptomyces aidingensis]SFD32867.1 Streptomyces sporulation and cell division protein, SsgA [Streptomyces aidingensis]
MHITIERELEMRLVVSPERIVPVAARLVYRLDDPFAVHILFHITSGSPVHWSFARDLLVEGVFRPAGHGDVRIWPGRAEDRPVVCIALNSPDGGALVQAAVAPVSAWLERTLRVVPPGTEPELSDLDAGLRALLTPSGPSGGEDSAAGRPPDDPGEGHC